MPAKTHTPVAALPVDDAAQLKQAHALEKVAKNERKLARAANRAAKQAPAVAETPADVDMVDSEERTAAETKAARKASKKEKKKMQALEQVEEDVEMVPAPPSVVKATKRKAVEVEEVVTAKKSKLVAASEPTPLAPVASTSAAKSPPIDALPLPTVNKIYTAPARPVYAHADTDLNIPGISAPRPLASTSPVKKTVPRSAIDPSLLDADDDAVLAAMQKAGLARKSPPQVSPAKKSAAASSKGKGKEVQALEETPEELKARNKAEKKEAKRLAKELAANPSPPADSPEDILANAVASFQSTVPIVPREVVVKRKPAKVVVGKVAKPKVKAAKETTSKLSDAELLSLDVKEMLATQWLSSTRLKQLSAEKGFEFKRGKFSKTEGEIVNSTVEDFRVLHSLSMDDIHRLCEPKSSTTDRSDLPDPNELFINVATALEGRPLSSVRTHVQRVCTPYYKLGAWTAEQDAALLAAFKQHGRTWKDVAPLVGRATWDCKTRYTNELQYADRLMGPWSDAEVAKLKKIMLQHGAPEGKPQNFKKVGLVFGPTRSPTQIRERWTGVQIKQKGTGISSRWHQGNNAQLVLAVKKMKVNDATEIDWAKIDVDGFGSRAKRQHLAAIHGLAKIATGNEELSHKKMIKWACKTYPDIDSRAVMTRITDKSVKRAASSKKESTSNHKSAQFVSESDDEGGEEDDSASGEDAGEEEDEAEDEMEE